MALYKIEINKKVRKKDLVAIPPKDVKRIIERIKKLAVDPFPIDAVQLKVRVEWRVRQGDYRILYVLDEDIITIYVIKIGHRKSIYK